MSWLTRLLRTRRLERELDRELAFHLEEHARRLREAGLSPAEARRQARMALGGVELVKEEARDARGTRWISEWWVDVRYAARGLRRAPGFAAAAILTLAIGIGANTAVFAVVDALLLRPLPVERPDQLRLLHRAGADDRDERGNRFSAAEFLELREATAPSARLTAFTPTFRLYTTIGDLPEMASGELVGGGWFFLLGAEPALGRLIDAADDLGATATPVAVLSHAFWSRRFGRDSAVIGSTVLVNGAAVTIIGVTRPEFFGVAFGVRPDLWLPLGLQPTLHYLGNASAIDADFQAPWWPQDGIQWLWILARVPPGDLPLVTGRLARAHRLRLEDRLARADSATRAFGLRERLVLEPAERGVSSLRDQLTDPFVALSLTVALVLLVTCANLAGLLLARSAGRQREMAVRVALGAGRARLMRQVLTESLLLALLGGMASVLVARLGALALVRGASTSANTIVVDLRVDPRLLAFVAAVSLASGLVLGLAPALRAARGASFGELRSGGRVVAERARIGRALVAGQVALSLVLVVLASLFARTFRNLTTLDPGFERRGLIAARWDLRAAGYERTQIPALYRRLLDAVRAVPGVRSVSLSAYPIGSGSSMTASFEVPGRAPTPDWDHDAQIEYVTPEFFATVGLPIEAGRALGDADREGTQRAAVVSRSMALHFFGTDSVIGRRFGFDENPDLEVIGIAPDVRFNSLADAPPRMVYLAAGQAPDVVLASLEARVVGSATAIGPAIRRAIAGVDPSLPVREVVPVSELLERQLAERRLAAETARIFGALALLLAAVGLYGVMAYSVARRTNEMGIRVALGAGTRGIGWLVLRETLAIVGAGLVAGLVLAWPVGRLVRTLLYGVTPADPGSLGLSAAVLLVVGLAAGAIPAWRAARVDPIEALRAD